MVALRSEVTVGQADRASLVAELTMIERRLEDGYQKIDQARLEGKEVGPWEELWIQLLDDYEQVYDLLAA